MREEGERAASERLGEELAALRRRIAELSDAQAAEASEPVPERPERPGVVSRLFTRRRDEPIEPPGD
jgi:hypothetical protein